MNLSYLLTFQNATNKAIERFPHIIVLCAIICFSLLLEFPSTPSAVPDYYITLVTTAFLFLILQLCAEALNKPTFTVWLVGCLSGAILGCALYFTPASMAVYGSLGLFNNALLWGAVSLPFLFIKTQPDNKLWGFNYQFWLHSLHTLFTMGALCIGAASILFSLNFLFGISISAEWYKNTFIVICTLITPLIWLAGIPTPNQPKITTPGKFVHYLVSYLVMPFLAVYAVMLHLYILKIALEWSLPKGGVAYLVSCFGGWTLFAAFVTHTNFMQSKAFAVFHRYFPWLLVMPLGLMAIGLYVRIHTYGVTVDRYLLALSLTWLAVSTALAFTKYYPRLPRISLTLLSGLYLAAAWGPLSAVSVTTQSQLAVLTQGLEKHQLLVNGTLSTPPHPLSPPDCQQLRSSAEILLSLDQTDQLKPWFKNTPNATIHHLPKAPNYITANNIMAEMGLNCSYGINTLDFSAYYNTFNTNQALAVSGFDYLIQLPWLSTQNNASATFNLPRPPTTITTAAKLNNQSLTLSSKIDKPLNISLSDVASIILKNKTAQQPDDGNKPSPIIEAENASLKVRLVVSQISLHMGINGNPPTVTSLSGYLLVRWKQ